MECPATPPNIEDCARLRTPSPNQEINVRKNDTNNDNTMQIDTVKKDDEKSNCKDKIEERCKSPDPTCAICLGQIENMSYTDSCLHKFCFTCLLEWSKVRPVCPLCKAKFKSIIHTIQSDNNYQSYHLPPPPNNNDNAQASRQEMALFLEEIQRFRQNLSQQFRSGFASFQPEWRQRSNRDLDQASIPHPIDLQTTQVLPTLPPFRFPSRSSSAGPLWNRRRGVATSAFRRNIYRQNLYVEAESIIDVTGRTRECSADWYRNNQAQTHRLVPWLNRELNALMEAQSHQVPYVLQLILDLIQRFNIQSPEFHEQIVPYTGTRTNHFQHEFYNFARSTYDMIGYDRHAMYSAVQPIETYVVSSESSSSEDEDVHVDEQTSVENDGSTINIENSGELVVVNENLPQHSSSNGYSNHNAIVHEPVASTSTVETEAIPQTSFPLIISSDESDTNLDGQDDEVEVVDYVKPLKDRTPVIVNIESSDEDIINSGKKIIAESSFPTESASSSNIPSGSLSGKTPAIVTVGDSSPESNTGSVQENYNRKSEKPLWKRNFDTCFPDIMENSRDNTSKRTSKKHAKSRKRSYSSSTSDKETAGSRRKGKSKVNKSVTKHIERNFLSTSSSSFEDEGGWFHQSQTSSENELQENNLPSSKGKGKGKGKSSRISPRTMRTDNIDNVKKKNRSSEKTAGTSSAHGHQTVTYQSQSGSTSESFYSDKEDTPLKRKKKSKVMNTKDVKIKRKKSHVSKHHVSSISKRQLTIDLANSTPGSTSMSRASLPKSDDISHDSKESDDSDELFLTKKWEKSKTPLDSDTSSVSLTDSIDEEHASYKGRKNLEKETKLRKRLIKKLQKKRSSKMKHNSSTTSNNPSVKKKRCEFNEKSSILDNEENKVRHKKENDIVKSTIPEEKRNMSASSFARISDLRERLNQKKKHKTKRINDSSNDSTSSDNDKDNGTQNERVIITSTASDEKNRSNHNSRIVTLHKSNND